MLQLYMALAVDWDEPHITRKLGMVIMYINNYEKIGKFPYLGGMVIYVVENNEVTQFSLLSFAHC